jgi:hypothetical protein
MSFNAYYILIFLSGVVIISYVFDLLAGKTRIPSTIMLLATGIALQFVCKYFGIALPPMDRYLQLFGIIGLILIVLEGTLDLELSREKVPMILKSLATALFTLFTSSFAIAYLIHWWLNVPLQSCLVNAIPMAITSSAIAIPSVAWLHKSKSEFIVYEVTFSDILGIMMFDFAIANTQLDSTAFLNFGRDLGVIIAISIVCCVLFIFFIERIQHHIKFFLIISLLVLVYSIGKTMNLSALILILVFGIAINNHRLYIRGKLMKFLRVEKIQSELLQLKMITGESAFLIRTFFFIIFGYSIHLDVLMNVNVLLIGACIMAIILVVRLFYLPFISRSNLFPAAFIAPRGLVTILLFYNIPAQFAIPEFGADILFFVVLVSLLIMMLALIGSKNRVIDAVIEESL